MNEFKKLHPEDINIHYVVKDVLRHFWVIILAAASAWMITDTACDLSWQPLYTSTATFAVSSSGSATALSNLSTTSSMAELFSSVFESDLLKSQVAEAMGEISLDAEISAQIISETNLLKVSATADTPEKAFKTLTAAIESYDEIATQMFSNVNLTALKEANVPMSASNPINSGSMKKRAAAAGALIAILITAVISACRETVQTRAGARHRLEGDLFGTISHDAKNIDPALQAQRQKQKFLPGIGKTVKTAALITNPLVSYHFAEDCQRLCSRLDYYMQTHRRQILLISSAAENEGKSTIAANLAIAMALRGKRVLLIDCDYRKPSQHKIFSVADDECADLVPYLIEPDGKDISDIFARKNGVTLAVDRKNYSHKQYQITEQGMKDFLARQKRNFDYIILDSPPMLVATDAEALSRSADEVLLVVRQDWSLIGDINDCIDSMRGGSAHFLGYVLNDMQVKGGIRTLPAR